MPLLVFVVLFYFTYAGIELCFRSFIAVFCVNSALAMTRAQVIYVASLSTKPAATVSNKISNNIPILGALCNRNVNIC